MTFYGKKTSFLPVLLILWLCVPFLSFAETKEMTDVMIDDNITLESQEEQGTEIEAEAPLGKKPLPTVSDDIKAKRVALEVPQEDDDTTVDITTEFNIPNVDTKRVQQAWLEMINNVRSEKAGDYTLDDTLISTSTERANHLGKVRKFKKMHQRPGQTCKNYRCYDLGDWFTTRGVSASAGESIGYGGYSCKKDDCTDALIEATKKTFRFFMSEAKRNGPHYQMVVSGKYSKVGIGIAQTKASRGNAYVLVMHVSK